MSEQRDNRSVPKKIALDGQGKGSIARQIFLSIGHGTRIDENGRNGLALDDFHEVLRSCANKAKCDIEEVWAVFIAYEKQGYFMIDRRSVAALSDKGKQIFPLIECNPLFFG